MLDERIGERRAEPADGRMLRERLLAELPLRERRLRLAGISTTVLEGGDGPPVLLLHGPGGYAAHWMRVVPGLVATHRVIAPDLPGHGASDAVEGALDAERVLAWLEELIQRTSASPPALVGHALSGAVAARFAGERGTRLDRLVLVDTFGLRALQPVPEFAAALAAYFAQPTQQTHRRLWRYCAHDAEALREALGGTWEPFEGYNIERARTPGNQAALAALLGEFGEPAIPSELLARIQVPTALIWGRHDLATPLAVAEAASARHGWPLHVIDGAADDPAIERPEAFLDALRIALADRDGRPASAARIEEVS